ncbi:MAG: CBS domain-containing protein [Candidatus Omnitrophica bacterium]|nr:CBS domain-containing protein [Candidatus Omnitrophota bacterium]
MFPVKDIMSKDVITATKDMPIYDAAQLLVDNDITGLPVVDQTNNLVGILSELDVLKLLTDDPVSQDRTVEDFMTKKVVAFEDTSTAVDICEFFLSDRGKRRVPITHEGKLVGLVSRADILQLIVKMRHRTSGS